MQPTGTVEYVLYVPEPAGFDAATSTPMLAKVTGIDYEGNAIANFYRLTPGTELPVVLNSPQLATSYK